MFFQKIFLLCVIFVSVIESLYALTIKNNTPASMLVFGSFEGKNVQLAEIASDDEADIQFQEGKEIPQTMYVRDVTYGVTNVPSVRVGHLKREDLNESILVINEVQQDAYKTNQYWDIALELYTPSEDIANKEDAEIEGAGESPSGDRAAAQ